MFKNRQIINFNVFFGQVRILTYFFKLKNENKFIFYFLTNEDQKN